MVQTEKIISEYLSADESVKIDLMCKYRYMRHTFRVLDTENNFYKKNDYSST